MKKVLERIKGLTGDVNGLTGDVSGLTGNVSGLRGDASGLYGNVIRMGPPLVATKSDIDQLVTALDGAFSSL